MEIACNFYTRISTLLLTVNIEPVLKHATHTGKLPPLARLESQQLLKAQCTFYTYFPLLPGETSLVFSQGIHTAKESRQSQNVAKPTTCFSNSSLGGFETQIMNKLRRGAIFATSNCDKRSQIIS